MSISQTTTPIANETSRILRITVAILLFAGLVLLVLTTIRFAAGIEARSILGQPNGFQGSSAVPKEEVEKLFVEAKTRIGILNHNGNRWRGAAFVFDWLAFLLATSIAALAAYYGRLPEGQTQQQQLDFLRRRTRRQSKIVGFCAAVMAVSTAVRSRCSMESSSTYHRADEIASAVQHTRTLLDSTTLSEAQARETVDELEQELQR